jgi:hypothetical protein
MIFTVPTNQDLIFFHEIWGFSWFVNFYFITLNEIRDSGEELICQASKYILTN